MDEKYRTRVRYFGTLQIKSDRRDIVVERAAKLLENSFETLDEALDIFECHHLRDHAGPRGGDVHAECVPAEDLGDRDQYDGAGGGGDDP